MHGEEEMNSTSTLDVWYDQKNNFINARLPFTDVIRRGSEVTL